MKNDEKWICDRCKREEEANKAKERWQEVSGFQICDVCTEEEWWETE